jgi:hypothetical protein
MGHCWLLVVHYLAVLEYDAFLFGAFNFGEGFSRVLFFEGLQKGVQVSLAGL